MLNTVLRKGQMPLVAPFMAFATDGETRAVVAQAAEDAGFSDPPVLDGGVAVAIQQLAEIPTPKLLVVDVSGGDPRNSIAELAEVCDEGTRVIAIGDVNDVRLYRELLSFGLLDYLPKPVDAEAVTSALQRATVEPQQAAPQEEKAAPLVGVIGVRGGVGTSTIATNIAWMLAHENGQRVALVDLDVHFGTCALALDLEPGRGFREALENPGRIDGLFIERAMVRESDNLLVLAAEESFENPAPGDPAALDVLLDHLRRDFGVVVADLPRSAVHGALASLTPPSRLIVVSDPSLAGMRDAGRLLGHLKKTVPQLPVTLIINRAGAGKAGELSRSDFERGIETKADYVIPYDPKPIGESAGTGKPLAKVGASSKSVATLRQICRAVGGDAETVAAAPFWKRLVKGSK